MDQVLISENESYSVVLYSEENGPIGKIRKILDDTHTRSNRNKIS